MIAGDASLANDAFWDVYKRFIFFVQWDNPNSAESVTKDGICMQAKCTLTPNLTDLANEPTLSCVYDKFAADNSTPIYWDLKPSVNYDSSTYDAAGTGAENVTEDTDLQNTTLNGNLCSELWYLGSGSIACVEMQAGAKRAFNTSTLNANADTDSDIILDYVEYDMYAKFAELDDTDDVFRFGKQTVNFNNLLASETNFSMLGFQLAGVSAIASIFAMLG